MLFLHHFDSNFWHIFYSKLPTTISIYFRETETYEYVYHPINALHLLKRVAKWIPKIKKQMPDFKFNFNLPGLTGKLINYIFFRNKLTWKMLLNFLYT